jgi:hypothetical protein
MKLCDKNYESPSIIASLTIIFKNNFFLPKIGYIFFKTNYKTQTCKRQVMKNDT